MCKLTGRGKGQREEKTAAENRQVNEREISCGTAPACDGEFNVRLLGFKEDAAGAVMG